MTVPSLFTFFGDPHPASQGYLKGSLLAQSASSLTVLVSGEPHTFPHFTTPLSSPSLESPFCNLTSIFCAAVCPEGTQMWGQRWGIIEKPITSPPPTFPMSQSDLRDSEWPPCTLLFSTQQVLSVCCIELFPCSFLFALQPPTPTPSQHFPSSLVP